MLPEWAWTVYSAMLEMIGSPACQCIFDQELTLLCANPSFYKSSGYSKEEFNSSCPTLRQYLHQHPGEFDIISQALSAAAEHGQNLFFLQTAAFR